MTLKSSVIKLLFWQLLNEINFDGNVRADGQRGERMASFLSKVMALKIASFVDKKG